MYCSQNFKACPSPSNELHFPATILSYSVRPKQAIPSKWKVFDGNFREFAYQKLLWKVGGTEKCFQIYCMMLCRSIYRLLKHNQIKLEPFFFSFFLCETLKVEAPTLLFMWLKCHLDDRFNVEIFLNEVSRVFLESFCPTHCSTILQLLLVFRLCISFDPRSGNSISIVF